MAIDNLRQYYDFLRSPWGEMQYRLTWEQLDFAQGMRVLDFGSGMGKTANHLAAYNEVTAVEPSLEMLEQRYQENAYTQIHGGIGDLPDEQFDLVTCHNVLEFVNDREAYLEALAKRVKASGRLSIVKHNLPGRVMRKAVGENDPAGALALMRGELPANLFGSIQLYGTGALIDWGIQHGLVLEKHCGVRSFYGLRQDNDGWEDPAWGEAAHDLEQAAAEVEPYRSIAFYHHVILRREVEASARKRG